MSEHHYGRRHGMHLQGKIMLRMMFLISLLGGLVRNDTQGKQGNNKAHNDNKQQRWVRQSSQTLIPYTGKKNYLHLVLCD